MVESRFVINDPKTGRSIQKVVDISPFLGKRIGDKIVGEEVGHPGYEFQITGGSDSAGFPMRADVQGVIRKRILITSGAGLRKKKKGVKKRKTVNGSTISSTIVQINAKVIKYGQETLFPESDALPKEEQLNQTEKSDVEKETNKQKLQQKVPTEVTTKDIVM